MKEINQQLKDLKAQREKWITRTFWMGLEIALIFAIPAILGAMLGKKLGGGAIGVGILAVTFILSWALVIRRYQKSAKQLRSIDSKIADLQESADAQSVISQEEIVEE